MKILILGCRGMLGTALMNVFSDVAPTGLDREDLDITERRAVHDLFSQLRPNVVLNAAAYTEVDACETSPDLAMQVNGDAVGFIAESCADIGARLVHFSTDYVFDGARRDGYREDDVPNPINVYGRSKLRGERLLQKNTTQYYLIRSEWLYGKHGKNFVDTMLACAEQKEAAIRVVDDQIGSPTYSADLAQAVRHMVDAQLPFGIYHLTNEGKTSWHGFAQEIFRLTGVDVHLEAICTDDLQREARRPAFSMLRNTKTHKLRPWKKALAEYLGARS